MKAHSLLRFLPALAAGLLLAAPATGYSRDKVTVYRDHDGDGHYNKKTYDPHDHHYYGGQSYRYGRGYGAPYYGYPRPYYGSSVGIYVAPRAYSTATYSYGSDGLAVDVQRELRRRGYYRGAVDGDIGSGTRSAIRAYQYDRGLAVTGRVDRSLVRALGIG